MFIRHFKNRHTSKSLGFGKPWVSWLWLDALLWASAMCLTRINPFFWDWCARVDGLIDERSAYAASYCKDTGYDCWIETYWAGLSPTEAVDSEMSYWEE